MPTTPQVSVEPTLDSFPAEASHTGVSLSSGEGRSTKLSFLQRTLSTASLQESMSSWKQQLESQLRADREVTDVQLTALRQDLAGRALAEDFGRAMERCREDVLAQLKQTMSADTDRLGKQLERATSSLSDRIDQLNERIDGLVNFRLEALLDGVEGEETAAEPSRNPSSNALAAERELLQEAQPTPRQPPRPDSAATKAAEAAESAEASVSALTERVASVESQLADLGKIAEDLRLRARSFQELGDDAAKPGAEQARAEAHARQRPASPGDPGGSHPESGETADMLARLKLLEQKLAKGPELVTSFPAGVEQRLAKLEEAVAAASQARPDSGTEARLAQLEEALKQGLAAAEAAHTEALAKLAAGVAPVVQPLATSSLPAAHAGAQVGVQVQAPATLKRPSDSAGPPEEERPKPSEDSGGGGGSSKPERQPGCGPPELEHLRVALASDTRLLSSVGQHLKGDLGAWIESCFEKTWQRWADSGRLEVPVSSVVSEGEMDRLKSRVAMLEEAAGGPHDDGWARAEAYVTQKVAQERAQQLSQTGSKPRVVAPGVKPGSADSSQGGESPQQSGAAAPGARSHPAAGRGKAPSSSGKAAPPPTAEEPKATPGKTATPPVQEPKAANELGGVAPATSKLAAAPGVVGAARAASKNSNISYGPMAQAIRDELELDSAGPPPGPNPGRAPPDQVPVAAPATPAGRLEVSMGTSSSVAAGVSLSRLAARVDALETWRRSSGFEEEEGAQESRSSPQTRRSSIVHGSDASNGNHNGTPFGMLLEMSNEVQGLRLRLAHLERCVPPDIQRGLRYFDPGAQSPLSPSCQDAPQGAQLVDDLNQARADVSDAMGEVANVTRVLRGLQRDKDSQAARMDDLARMQQSLRSRVEATLPRLRAALEDINKRLGVEEGGVDAPESLGALLRLALEDAEGGAAAPRQAFVSPSALQSAVEEAQAELKGEIRRLASGLSEAIDCKADAAKLDSLAARLESVSGTRSVAPPASPCEDERPRTGLGRPGIGVGKDSRFAAWPTQGSRRDLRGSRAGTPAGRLKNHSSLPELHRSPGGISATSR